MFHAQAFLDLNACLSSIFGLKSVNRYLAFISTYPTGMWSLRLHERKELNYTYFNIAQSAIFSQKHQLKYYTPDIHLAAFTLPPYIRKMLQDRLAK